jgi:hypothetical protein
VQLPGGGPAVGGGGGCFFEEGHTQLWERWWGVEGGVF